MPHPIISNVIWVLSSDTLSLCVSSTNYFQIVIWQCFLLVRGHFETQLRYVSGIDLARQED